MQIDSDRWELEPPEDDTRDEAYSEGAEACAAGTSALRNPYAGRPSSALSRPIVHPLAFAWAHGWRDEDWFQSKVPRPCPEGV